jgi:cell division protein FtsB
MKSMRFKGSNFSLIKVLESKIFISLGLIVLVFISIALGREIAHRNQIRNQIESLKSEISSLEQKNIELGSLIEYLKTPSFKEKEARTRLGLQKPGESVISVPEEEINEENSNLNIENSTNNSKIANTNPKKWWSYFFTKL